MKHNKKMTEKDYSEPITTFDIYYKSQVRFSGKQEDKELLEELIPEDKSMGEYIRMLLEKELRYRVDLNLNMIAIQLPSFKKLERDLKAELIEYLSDDLNTSLSKIIINLLKKEKEKRDKNAKK